MTKVPNGMLKAAMTYSDTEEILEAALKWLEKNPIVPTPEEIEELYREATTAPFLYDFPGSEVVPGTKIIPYSPHWNKRWVPEQQMFVLWAERMFLVDAERKWKEMEEHGDE